jgi:putative transcription antitermination factor YqgF
MVVGGVCVVGWVEPWGVVERVRVVGEIKEVCRKKKIEKIILGLPEGRLAKQVAAFGQELRRKTGLPVELAAETLTSQDAVAKMREIGLKQKERQVEDAFAAALILESYVERTKKNG